MALVHHGSGRTDIHRNAQGQLFRLHFQSPQPRCFFRQTHCGNDSRGAAGTLFIHLSLPIPPLLLQIVGIVKPPYFEKRGLNEAHQVFHAPFLLGTVGPTQLHTYPHLQRGVSKYRVPFRYLAVFAPLQSHRLGSIKYTQQRQATPAGQVLRQRSYQSFHALVLHQTDAHPAGVLQPREAKGMDALARAIQELDVYLPKIVLTELSR